jgi:hypothetical protein
MASFGAVWIQLGDREADLDRLKAQGRSIDPATVASHDFVCVHVDADPNEYPDDLLAEFSQTFGDAIFLGVDTDTNALVYGHWQQGELVRELTYAEGDGWLQVSGETEAWEDDILFAPEGLPVAIATIGEDYAEEIQQFWDHHLLEEGRQVPAINAKDVYQLLLSHFNMPDVQ